ncbi:hypothetical protein [Shewanella woodyi]|uniref:Uncharacterized protein n=1 Tax=Shewanella woodyi (strain ATCC 51908 / MS32) TaxID=392500 RepID=B1KHQ7_SHEWM|nr:hypothetical protein [Shewanella woodyi]ACA88385.1 conserved hypothetical protein [Shewanella woodyi ATCC 51908]
MDIRYFVALSMMGLSHSAYTDQTSSIGSGSFQNVQGRTAVNIAAGDQNVQANAHSIGPSVTLLSIQESLFNDPILDEYESINSSVIESQAFVGAQGLIGINQVSGRGNTQANLGTIELATVNGLGLSALGLSDSALTQVSSSPSPISVGQQASNSTDIALDSFSEVQGIVQLNQISGDGNTAINRFSLQLSSGN